MSKYFALSMISMAFIAQIFFATNVLAAVGDPNTDAMHVEMVDESNRSLNPLRYGSAQELIGVVIRALLAFIGSIAMVLYVWAGITWMTAAGNAEKVKQAANIFIWTSLGVTVMLGSYVIVNFIFSKILQVSP